MNRFLPPLRCSDRNNVNYCPLAQLGLLEESQMHSNYMYPQSTFIPIPTNQNYNFVPLQPLMAPPSSAPLNNEYHNSGNHLLNSEPSMYGQWSHLYNDHFNEEVSLRNGLSTSFRSFLAESEGNVDHSPPPGSPVCSTSASYWTAQPGANATVANANLYNHVPISLSNYANTCYMNSVLQCLLHTPHLLSSLQVDQRRVMLANGHVNMSDPMSVRACQSFCNQHLLSVSSLLHLGLLLSYSQHRQCLQFIKMAVSERNDQFASSCQNDAHEFLRTFLHSIHDSINRGTAVHGTLTNQSFIKAHDEMASLQMWVSEARKVDNSTVHDFFGGVLRSRLTCQFCGYSSIAFDPFLDLSLPLKRTKLPASLRNGLISHKLVHLLHEYFVNDTVVHFTGSNKIQCQCCNTKREGTLTTRVMIWPRTLVLHLKRFDKHGKKSSVPVEYPHRFTVSGLHYRLYGICCHTGTAKSGHYLSYVQQFASASGELPSWNSGGRSQFLHGGQPTGDRWFRCNDELIEESTASVAMCATSDAYIFFYVQEYQ